MQHKSAPAYACCLLWNFKCWNLDTLMYLAQGTALLHLVQSGKCCHVSDLKRYSPELDAVVTAKASSGSLLRGVPAMLQEERICSATFAQCSVLLIAPTAHTTQALFISKWCHQNNNLECWLLASTHTAHQTPPQPHCSSLDAFDAFWWVPPVELACLSSMACVHAFGTSAATKRK